MNKKGFTLVELLAVMALVAMLSGVAVAATTKWIVKSKKDTFTNYEENLQKAAENYISSRTDLVVPGDTAGTNISAADMHDSGVLENLIDPIKKEPCSYKNSYVNVKGVYDTADSCNITYKYITCLRCPNYTSEACSNPVFSNIKIVDE